MFTEVTTGIIYKNPVPHLKSVHAYFPSVAKLGDGSMWATSMTGEAFEAIDTRVFLHRSLDSGEIWEQVGQLCHDLEGKQVSESARITATGPQQLTVILHRHHRSQHPDLGLANPENMGFVPTEFAISQSNDSGKSWSPPAVITPPLEGPSFELCAPITVLSDGRWLLPCSTWRGWDGSLPNGNRMIAFVSEDQGATWPTYLDVMHHSSNQILYWESKIVEFSDGRLLAIAWVYDEQNATDLPNHYSLSSDGGQTWTTPQSMDLIGQTLTPTVVGDDKILSIYRRVDKPGLWAQLSHLDGEKWINDEETPLWGNQAAGLTQHQESMVENFQGLRFGAPCITKLSDKTYFAAFWCYEDCVSVIRWFRLTLP